MYAYKGFEPDLSCRGYRFVMGKNVTPEANCASNGFHCAENPLDCLSYYGDMNRSIYYLVQPGGDIDEDDRDSKIACTELTILRRLTRKEFFLHALAYMVDHPGRKVSDKVQREHSTSRNGYAIVRGKTPAACGKLGDIHTIPSFAKSHQKISCHAINSRQLIYLNWWLSPCSIIVLHTDRHNLTCSGAASFNMLANSTEMLTSG